MAVLTGYSTVPFIMPPQQLKPTTEGEFGRLFRERLGREYDKREPLLSLSEEEFACVWSYLFGEIEAYLYQFAYRDPATRLTYDGFYDFDVDQSEAVVVYALLEGRQVRLTRGLRQRLTQAAFEQWLREATEETSDSLPG